MMCRYILRSLLLLRLSYGLVVVWGALVPLVVTVVMVTRFGTTLVVALPDEVERRSVVECTFQRITTSG